MPRTEGAQALFRQGEEAARRGDWLKAAELFGKAAEADATNAACHLAAAQSLQMAGRPALGPFLRALELAPASVEALWGIAAEHSRRDAPLEALKWLKAYVEARVERGDRSPRAAPARPTKVPATTLACVDTANYALAAHALRRTLEQCDFERALFFTDADLQVEGVETVRIAPIRSLEDYSRFIIKDLDRHVESDHVLVMQWDGYVLDGARWSAEFQRFDYVGAPWQGGEIGNGGFSLRSKRLLRALQDPAVTDLTPEDLAICRTYRPMLEERYAIRFAPAEVAARFSFEMLPPPGPTFGFHGVHHLAATFDMTPAELAAYRPEPLRTISFSAR
jgi:tetratricopeptide (TPR) repeat protein